MTKRKISGQMGDSNLCLTQKEKDFGYPVFEIVKKKLCGASVTLSPIVTRQYVGINVWLRKQSRYKAICRVFFLKNGQPKLGIYNHKCKRVLYEALNSPADVEKYRADIEKYAQETKVKRGI